MMHIDDFQPGDGTRYLMFAETTVPGLAPLGYTELGCIVFGVVNMGHVAEVPMDGHLMYIDLAERWPKANPWTIRACLLWLRTEAKERRWPLTVVMDGCPVGGDDVSARSAS